MFKPICNLVPIFSTYFINLLKKTSFCSYIIVTSLVFYWILMRNNCGNKKCVAGS